MPAERYFIEALFERDQIIELKGAELHHLVNVMRTKTGETVELVNGKGGFSLASLEGTKKDRAELKIIECRHEPDPLSDLILAQALPKANRLEYILEKGTELGVKIFWLFPGSRSIKKDWYPNQMERARSVTIAAMKQCGRLYLPEISFLPPLSEWTVKSDHTFFFGDLSPEAPLFQEIWKKDNEIIQSIVFITGPEGGFSPEEVQYLRSYGAKGVKLHQNVLRTDTASIMALSLMSHWGYSTTPL